MEDFIAKLGLKIPHIIAGIFGGVFIVFFGQRPRTLRDRIGAFTTVILSAVATGYLTPLILSVHPAWITGEHGIAFVVGLFGMGVIHGTLNIVNKFVTDGIATIKSIRSIWFGK